MQLRPSIEAADLLHSGARQPLPKTARCRSPCDSLGRCARIARAAPARADPAQNVLTLHADLAIPTRAGGVSDADPAGQSVSGSAPRRSARRTSAAGAGVPPAAADRGVSGGRAYAP